MGSEVITKGERVYQRILPRITAYRGKFIAIEVESEDYWIGDTLIEAMKQAQAAYPAKRFFVHQIGEEVVSRFR